MGPLTLGDPGVSALAEVRQSTADGTRAEIQITITPTQAEDLVQALTGSRPDLSALPGVPLTPMDLTTQETTDTAAWAIRFLLENAGQDPASLLETIATALRAT